MGYHMFPVSLVHWFGTQERLENEGKENGAKTDDLWWISHKLSNARTGSLVLESKTLRVTCAARRLARLFVESRLQKSAQRTRSRRQNRGQALASDGMAIGASRNQQRYYLGLAAVHRATKRRVAHAVPGLRIGAAV